MLSSPGTGYRGFRGWHTQLDHGQFYEINDSVGVQLVPIVKIRSRDFGIEGLHRLI